MIFQQILRLLLHDLVKKLGLSIISNVLLRNKRSLTAECSSLAVIQYLTLAQVTALQCCSKVQSYVTRSRFAMRTLRTLDFGGRSRTPDGHCVVLFWECYCIFESIWTYWNRKMQHLNFCCLLGLFLKIIQIGISLVFIIYFHFRDPSKVWLILGYFLIHLQWDRDFRTFYIDSRPSRKKYVKNS